MQTFKDENSKLYIFNNYIERDILAEHSMFEFMKKTIRIINKTNDKQRRFFTKKIQDQVLKYFSEGIDRIGITQGQYNYIDKIHNQLN